MDHERLVTLAIQHTRARVARAGGRLGQRLLFALADVEFFVQEGIRDALRESAEPINTTSSLRGIQEKANG